MIIISGLNILSDDNEDICLWNIWALSENIIIIMMIIIILIILYNIILESIFFFYFFLVTFNSLNDDQHNDVQ